MDENEEVSLDRLKELVDCAEIVRVVNLILSQAINDRATAIHVEPEEKDIRVRYRVDNVLYEVMRPPKRVQLAVAGRLKIMANMDIAERRIAQDGRIDLTHDGKDYQLWVTSLPGAYGDAFVLNIRPLRTGPKQLDQLGFAPNNQQRLRSMLERPSGLILASGVPGSGRTTTLYSCLGRLNDGSRSILTLEKHVESKFAGMTQIELTGMSTDSCLRACLRSDPDVIMVGDLRDGETARLAVEAAFARHLVLAGCSGRTSSGLLARLLDMGVEPYLLSLALSGVVTQMLARKLCPECKTGPTEVPSLGSTTCTPAGCPSCHFRGHAGLQGIQEVLLASEAIGGLILKRESAAAIHDQACREGMSPLRQDGLRKMNEGHISAAEFLRVLPPPVWPGDPA